MLEMTVVGLDGHWETTAPLMHSSFNDGVIQLSPLSSYSVLEIVEISHASFVHLLLQYVPHTVVSWIYFLRIWRPQYRRNEFWISFCLAKTAFFNDVTITSSLRTVVQVLIGLFFTIFQSPEVSGWFMPKIVKSCLNLSNLRPNYYRSILFFRTPFSIDACAQYMHAIFYHIAFFCISVFSIIPRWTRIRDSWIDTLLVWFIITY